MAHGTVKFLSKTHVGNTIEFLLGNGHKLVIKPDEYPDNIKRALMFHGASQKIGDGAAGFSKQEDYKGALAEMQAIHESMLAGDWKREGGGFGISIDDLASAISAIKKVPVEKAKKAVEAASVEKRKEWASNKKVIAHVADLRAKRLREAAKEEQDEIDVEL